MASLENDAIKLNTTKVAMHAIITGAVSQLEASLPEKTITLKLLATSDEVLGDSLHLTNVIHNLLDNAIKYSPSPAIIVTTKNQNNKLLILDFVPNHVAVDHNWIVNSPECFIQGTSEELRLNPDNYYQIGDNIFAHGKDPFFPSWTDTAQLNAFSEKYRKKVIGTLLAKMVKNGGRTLIELLAVFTLAV